MTTYMKSNLMDKKTAPSPLNFFSLSMIFISMLIFLAGLFAYKAYNMQKIVYNNMIGVERAYGSFLKYNENITSTVQLGLSSKNSKFLQSYSIYTEPFNQNINTLKLYSQEGNEKLWSNIDINISRLNSLDNLAFLEIKNKNYDAAYASIYGVEYQELKLKTSEMIDNLVKSTINVLNTKINEATFKMNVAALIIITSLAYAFIVTFLTNKTISKWRIAVQSSYAKLFTTKKEIRDSSILLNDLNKNTTDGILTIDSSYRIKTANPSAEKIFNIKSEEILGKDFHSLFSPACHTMLDDEFEQYFDTGKFSIFNKQVDLKAVNSRGKDIILKTKISPISLQEETLFHIVIQDISNQINQQIQMVDSLKDARHMSAYLKSLLANAPDGIIIVNDIGDIELFNPSAEKIFGYKYEEIIGKKFKQLFEMGEDNNNIFNKKNSPVLGKRKNNELFSVSLDFSEFTTDEGVFFTCFIREGVVQQDKQSSAPTTNTNYDDSFLDNMKFKVLLAEDNPINLTLTSHIVKSLGNDVVQADSGKEVLNQLSQGNKFDTIILNTEISDIDGYQLTQLIRNHEKENGLFPTNIVGIIGKVESNSMQKCMESGMDDYCHRPINSDSLKNKIKIKSAMLKAQMA